MRREEKLNRRVRDSKQQRREKSDEMEGRRRGEKIRVEQNMI